jgi:CDP-6-deoxy-D-xylo-4-hexulose-3-dehydrase
MIKNLTLPLMSDNIDRDDINHLVEFLQQDPIPRLTNGEKVIEFENAWSNWLGVKYSIFVNSGTSANELTMLALKYMYPEGGEIIMPPLAWISDINSVLFAGFDPVFVDINLKNLSFDMNKLENKVTSKTKAIFITHVLGLNGLTKKLLEFCEKSGILLIEDVCESYGATFNGTKLGSIGFASNFSFYFAHHMSTIEGGMVSTNDDNFYQFCRSLRSHGMVRELTDESLKSEYRENYSDLNQDFVFIGPAHNFRSTEINAVLGLFQLKKLDDNNLKRVSNFEYFLNRLDSKKYYTDFNIDGQCNYAFIIIMKNPNIELRNRIENTLEQNGIEFRRGLSGGGNQLRQPFFKDKNIDYNDFKNVDYVHNFGWYVGNYPSLEIEKIDNLVRLLNEVK